MMGRNPCWKVRDCLLLYVGIFLCSSCTALPSQSPHLDLGFSGGTRPALKHCVWSSTPNHLARESEIELNLRGGSTSEAAIQQSSLRDLYYRCRYGPSAAVETASNCIRHAQSVPDVQEEQDVEEVVSVNNNAEEEDEFGTGPLQELFEVESRRLALEDLDAQTDNPDFQNIQPLTPQQQLDLGHDGLDSWREEHRDRDIESLIAEVTDLESEAFTPGRHANHALFPVEEDSSEEERQNDLMNRINRQEPAESATPRPKQHQVHAEHEDEEIGQVFNSNRAEHDTMSETQTPPGLSTQLMTHQRMALAWMQRREEIGQVSSLFWENVTLTKNKHEYINFLTGEDRPMSDPPMEARGGILADDMGLGKTLTVLALIVSELIAPPTLDDEEDGDVVEGLKQLKLTELFHSLVSTDATESGESVDGHEERRGRGGGGAVLGGGERGERRAGPTLIVCPLSVLQNWQGQIKAHTNDQLRVLLYHGASRSRSIDELSSQDIVLTTYATLTSEYSKAMQGRRDGGAKRAGRAAGEGSMLHCVQWWRVVLDEAHMIANPKAKQTKAALMLEAGRRWAVTGTPLQNKIEDLHSLFAFLRLDPLDDPVWFSRLIKDPMKSKNAEKRSNSMILVRTVLSVYCLRRTKDQEIRGKPIVVLPRKRILLRELELSREEQALYDRMFASGKAMFRSLMRTGSVMTHYTQILTRLLRLRQLCCHPWLLPTEVEEQAGSKRSGQSEEEVQRLAEVMAARLASGEEECCVCLDSIEVPVITKCKHIFCRACMAKCLSELSPKQGNGIACPLCRGIIVPDEVVEMPIRIAPRSAGDERHASSERGGGEEEEVLDAGGWVSSTKLNAVLEELATVERESPGEKVVIFSQFTSFLDILERGLERAATTFLRLDGTMKREHRQNAVEQFQTDPAVTVLLVSIKSGGTGINLVAANHVFFTDLWWNRAVEEQAMDRVHRMGQKKEVQSAICLRARYAIAGTIEERIVELQEKKCEMIRGAMGGASSGRLQHARTADLQMLFR